MLVGHGLEYLGPFGADAASRARLDFRSIDHCGVRSVWLTESPSVPASGDRIEDPMMGQDTSGQSPAMQMAPEGAAEPASRQCGRCREFFPIATSTDPTLEAKWWLCAACRTKFFGTP